MGLRGLSTMSIIYYRKKINRIIIFCMYVEVDGGTLPKTDTQELDHESEKTG